MPSTHTKKGKWTHPGVPHKGWVNIKVEDLEDDKQLCMMCGSAEIRFAHYMEHENYDGILIVGCVCAQHMEADYTAAVDGERPLRDLARRQKTWHKKNWQVSRLGITYLNTEGFHIAVFQSGRNGS